MTNKLLILLVFAILMLASVSGATAEPLNLRFPAPSPDGSKVCFSYLGDLWLVSSQGGRAERLTVHVGYDAYPRWSPDGKYIAFSSDRYGNFDVFIAPVSGGAESRITYHSSDDIVSAWTPDGKGILFTAKREQPFETIWEVSAGGGRAKPLLSIAASCGRLSPDDDRLLFTRGAVPYWRKGYRGSAACDLFIKELNSGAIERITAATGNNLEGCWTAEAKEILYLSDSTGSYNLFKKNLANGTVTQLTNHRLSASHPCVSADGSLAAYELAGEIFLYDLKAGQGRKLIVDAPSGTKVNADEKIVCDSGITEFAVSPDGEMIAYVLHGEIFCRDIDGSHQRQLTHSPAGERDLSWSSDSRQLVFASNQDFSYDIYMIRSADADETSLSISHERETVNLVRSDVSKRSPQISPDQSKLAYLRSQTQLVITDLKRFTERTLTDIDPIGSFAWSPDGRYVVFTQSVRDWHNELFIGDSESGSVYKVSDSPGNYRLPRFSLDGKLIYYIDDEDIYCLYLEQRLAEMSSLDRHRHLEKTAAKNAGGPPPVMIDFDGITLRHMQVTHLGNVTEAVITRHSESFIYATVEGGLERVTLDGGESKLLTGTLAKPSSLQIAPGSGICYLKDESGLLCFLTPEDDSLESLPFKAEVLIDARQQFIQTFNEVWQTLREEFYDESLHGASWNDLREKYLPRVQAATEVNDFYDIIRELLGELNASHLDIWPARPKGGEMGYLGVIPDYDDNSAGLKIKSIIPNSPAAKLISQLRVEEKITGIDDHKLTANQDYSQYLEGTAGKEIKLDVFNRDGLSRAVKIVPATEEEFRELAYNDQINKMRELVDRISNRKIAYVHLQQTDGEGLMHLESDLKKYAGGREGLVLDMRGNVGGAAHDKLLELLSRKIYVTYRPRHGSSGYDSPGSLKMPVVLLVDELTSSDAEIFAHGFRKLQLGTIVGTTTYGAVIGASLRPLVDGSTLAVPSVGWYTLEGEELEMHGVTPDIAVPVDLPRLERGEDNQLEEAVQILLSKDK